MSSMALETRLKCAPMGVAPPLKVTAKDHEGGGLVRVFQTRGGKIIPVTDWFHGYREAVLEQVYAAAKEEPPKN